MFLLFADYGFDLLLVTEVARQRTHKVHLANRYLSLKIITAICSAFAMMLFGLTSSMDVQIKIMTVIFAFYVLCTSLQTLFFSLFKGLEQLNHETRILFVTNLIALLLLVIIGYSHAPIIYFAVLMVVTRVVGLIMVICTATLLLGKHWFKFSLVGWREIWKKVAVFGSYVILGVLYFQMDTILLAFWKGDQAVGIYQSVFRIILLLLVIVDVGISVLMPALARYYSEGSKLWNQVGNLLYRTLFLIALPITMILFVYAEQVIIILYGKDKFIEAVPILRIFSLIGFIRFAAEPFGLMLTTGQRQTTRMVIIAIAAITNLSLNMHFIPIDGPIGAAKVSLITNSMVAVLYIATTRPFLGSWLLDIATVVPFIVTIILSSILWYFKNISLWYIGIPAIMICLVVNYWFGYTSNERKMLFTFNTLNPL